MNSDLTFITNEKGISQGDIVKAVGIDKTMVSNKEQSPQRAPRE